MYFVTPCDCDIKCMFCATFHWRSKWSQLVHLNDIISHCFWWWMNELLSFNSAIFLPTFICSLMILRMHKNGSVSTACFSNLFFHSIMFKYFNCYVCCKKDKIGISVLHTNSHKVCVLHRLCVGGLVVTENAFDFLVYKIILLKHTKYNFGKPDISVFIDVETKLLIFVKKTDIHFWVKYNFKKYTITVHPFM